MKRKLLSLLIIATMLCTALPTFVFADTTINTVHNSATLQLEKPDTTEAIKWKSSNKKIATVKDGVVTGLKAGKCKITAMYGDTKQVYIVNVPSYYEGFKKIPDFGALYGKKNVMDMEEMQKELDGFFAGGEDNSIFGDLLKQISNAMHYGQYDFKNKKQAKAYAKKYEKKLKKLKFKNDGNGNWTKNDMMVTVAKDGKQIVVCYLNMSDLDLSDLEDLYDDMFEMK